MKLNDGGIASRKKSMTVPEKIEDYLWDPKGASFGDRLKELMARRNLTVERLAEGAYLSPKAVQRMRTMASRPKLSCVIAVCIAMHLPPSVSYDLLELAGYRLGSSYGEDRIYRYLLDKAYSKTLDECNDILCQLGLPAIGNDIG